jgi:hypothetical protein
VYIREATPEDNDKLEELQSKCPQGTNLIVSVVNTPGVSIENKPVFVDGIDL